MQVGDIILRHSGTSFIARSITKFMTEYADKKSAQIPHIFHHAGTIVEHEGVLKVAEAIQQGYAVRPLLECYSEEEWSRDICVYTPKLPYSDQAKKFISSKAVDLALHATPYDLPNFIFQIIHIKTGLWLGPKGKKAEMMLYCSEGAALLANLAQSWVFPNYEEINPVDIAMSPYLRLLCDGVPDIKKYANERS